jgi:hypothetical protein
LAAYVKTQAFNHQTKVERLINQSVRFSGLGAEFGAHFNLGADVRDLKP